MSIVWGADRSILVNDIVDVEKGATTDVFAKSDVDPDMCFSIITPDRTLDLECMDRETRDEWFVFQKIKIKINESTRTYTVCLFSFSLFFCPLS